MIASIEDVAQDTSLRLHMAGSHERWAGLAAIWARLWVLAGPGLRRWPEAAQSVFEALSVALARAAGLPTPSSIELALLRLEALEVDDDGSAEWQYLVDLAVVLSIALDDHRAEQCVEETVRTFLEGTFNVLANELAVERGRSISETEADVAIEGNHSWVSAVEFVRSL